jgi:hypothetical protein
MLVFCPAGDVPADVVQLAAVRDTTLIEDPAGALSNGAGAAIFTGRTGQLQGSLRRGLLAFDVADAIPAPARIKSVELWLRVTDSGGGEARVTLHRLDADWGEAASNASGGRGAPAEPGDATWVHRFYDTEPWAADGGDYAPRPSATALVAGPGDYVWQSTPRLVADVQAWVDGVAGEDGWLLLGAENRARTTKRFASREHEDPEAVPLLIVEFERQPSCAAAGLPHAAHALCHVYCELLDCETAPGDAPGCEAFARAYREHTGGAFPVCTTPPTDAFP